MDVYLEWLSWVLIAAGSFVVVVGALGIFRMPDVFSRMHAAGMIAIRVSRTMLISDSNSALLIRRGEQTVFFRNTLQVIIFGKVRPNTCVKRGPRQRMPCNGTREHKQEPQHK